MSDFENRINTADGFVERMKEYYWKTIEIQNKNIHMHEYGYENFIDKEMMNILRTRRSNTAKFIRYAPDYILCSDEKEVLLEYKVTKTPRYTYKELQWDRGQIEADAFDNYINLCKANIEVAVLIYCPYHSYPVLCGIPNMNWIIGDRQRTYQSSGSGTEFYNIDLNKIEHFDIFMEKHFGISHIESKELLKRMLIELKKDKGLQTVHARNSYYNDGKHLTGFNWKLI